MADESLHGRICVHTAMFDYCCNQVDFAQLEAEIDRMSGTAETYRRAVMQYWGILYEEYGIAE